MFNFLEIVFNFYVFLCGNQDQYQMVGTVVVVITVTIVIVIIVSTGICNLPLVVI